jgi:uncharacterized membrane protein YidH (DUF202 family)
MVRRPRRLISTGGTRVTHKGWITELWERRNGSWRILCGLGSTAPRTPARDARPCSPAPARGSIANVEEGTPETTDAETALNVGMAAERTWLAWWRTALVATAGALGVGRLAPRLLHAAAAPYVVLGCGYAVLALALLIVGSRRHRALARAIERGEPAPLTATTVTLFTVGGVVLATVTTVVVLAQA